MDTSPIDAARDANQPDVVDPVCETLSAEARAVPATLLFQLDTSNSMNCLATDPGCVTGDPTPAPSDSRWDVLALELASALSELADDTTVGVMRFPRAGGACARDELLAPLGPVTNGVALAAVQSIVPDGLSTPTHDAVAFGVGRLQTAAADQPYVVLATDGDARVCFGCVTDCAFDDPSALDRDNEALIIRVAAAAEAGVPTFVIGVPGSQGFRDVLSRLATAAGTARPGCSDTGPMFCHYDLTDPSLDFGVALRETLATIGDAVIGCTYEIPDNPDGTFDPTKVNVRLRTGGSTETVPRDMGRTTGWDYSDDMSRVELHGAACERAQAADTLDISFGCPTILI